MKTLRKRDMIYAILGAVVAEVFLGGYNADILANSSFSPSKSTIKIEGNISGNAIVTDGDTIKINGIRIRLHGIDAPEINQPCWKNSVKYQCGLDAKSYLVNLINDQIVMCNIINQDRYGRKIAKCSNYENIDINAMMVLSGNATAYLYYSQDYAKFQAEAKNKKRGIWTGRFMEPYQYRKK